MNVVIDILDINKITLEEIERVKNYFPKRFQSAERYIQEKDKLRSIGGSLLILKNFGKIDENRIKYGEYKKPYIEGMEDFNISHSGDYVVFVKSSGIVGVDIEKKDERHLVIVDKLFTKEEMDYINKDRLTNFFILWCQKESVMKATGKGLRLGPKEIDVMPFQRGENISILGNDLFNKTILYKDYIISITCSEIMEKVEINNYNS